MAKGMKVITARDVIRGVRERWNTQYPKDDYQFWDKSMGGAKRSRLNALDLETCSSADVDAALGIKGWADNQCDFCDESKPLIVRLGDDPDYEARWVDICDDCLASARAAAAIIQTVK